MIPDLLWTLIALQIAMGAFDTLYHHELTERLAWRPSQKRELQLHAVRNWLYALLFAALGWSQPHGWLAVAGALILAVEVVITLWDFVEEDLSRRLPASERVNHTLLALNYGAILVLLVPVLVDWAARETALLPAYHGAWSWLSAASALGVGLFGVRDFAAARRSERLVPPPADGLIPDPGRPRTVLVTGATGFIGRRLVEALVAGGYRVIALVRDPGAALPLPVALTDDLERLPADTRIDAVVNLAGEPIAAWWWTTRRRRTLIDSRLAVTRAVIRLIARLDHRPEVLVSGSAIGWYGVRGDERLDEASGFDPCFSHDLTAAWEAEAAPARDLGVRLVLLRIGLVLGLEGGVMARMLTPFEFGLGGPIGDGRQWMSWISRDDLVRLIGHAIRRPELTGRVNATAPRPVRNRDFARALGRALGRPAVVPVPAAILRLLGGTLARELLLGGQHVTPLKAVATGFVFRDQTLDQALAAILGQEAPKALPAPRAAESLQSAPNRV